MVLQMVVGGREGFPIIEILYTIHITMNFAKKEISTTDGGSQGGITIIENFYRFVEV
jgi:hypothetical protein